MLIGGNGFIGRSLAAALPEYGHDVVSISRDLPVSPQAGVEYIDCGYDQFSALGGVYEGCDAIVHLAWDTTPALSAGTPAVEVGANLLPLGRFLEGLEAHFRGQLLFVSSGGAVYGDGALGGSDGLQESAALRPLSYYGAAKAAAEMFLGAFHHRSGLPVTVLRPSNVYGPGQAAKRFFAVVPTLFEALQWGATFRVIGDGSAARDYLFIDDFCALVNCIVNAPAAPPQVRWHNACSGQSVQLIDLIRTAEAVSGLDAVLEFVPLRDSDVRTVSLSAASTAAEYDWRAHTSLQDGLAKTWQWTSRH